MHNEYLHKTVLNLPVINKPEESAIDAVVNVINNTKQWFGLRQNLFQLARSRKDLSDNIKVCLRSLTTPPLVDSAKKIIRNAIENVWQLSETFRYSIEYTGNNPDECHLYYYFEVVFSQPSVQKPVPQVTASVFFTVAVKQFEPVTEPSVPSMSYRIEGHFTDHDIRFVTLTKDWILALMKMKMNVAKRLEAICMF